MKRYALIAVLLLLPFLLGQSTINKPPLTVSDSATKGPFVLTQRAAAPSSPTTGMIYLDDGTAIGGTDPIFMRYTGIAWEVIGGPGTGIVLGDLATTSPVLGAASNIFPGANGTKATISLDFTSAATWDFGAVARLSLRHGTDPDVTSDGDVAIDTDGGNEPNSVTLRTIEGDDQYVLCDSLETYSWTITEPDLLAQADFLPLLPNKTGFTFVITAIGGESDIDNFDFTLKERDPNGANVTTIEAVQLTTDGTSMYYGSVVFANIDHTTIEAGHTVGMDNSADDATYVMIWIQGYYNANVD